MSRKRHRKYPQHVRALVWVVVVLVAWAVIPVLPYALLVLGAIWAVLGLAGWLFGLLCEKLRKR